MSQHVSSVRSWDVGEERKCEEYFRGQLVRTISAGDSEAVIQSDLFPSTHMKEWTKVKSTKFLSKPPWCPAVDSFRLSQVVYAGDSVFGIENRHDAVEYTVLLL